MQGCNPDAEAEGQLPLNFAIGNMEKKMEASRWDLGFRDILPPVPENQMEKNIEHEMETGVYTSSKL